MTRPLAEQRGADTADEPTSSPGPGVAALCVGRVRHRRTAPREHSFVNRVSYVWIDPDRPGDLCDRHPWWSATHAAPARFRAADYGDGSDRPLGDQVRDLLAPLLGNRPGGPIRMLTQIRRWGWLFNPITVYIVWDDSTADDDVSTTAPGPIAAVLEVTNTPWRERVHYPIALEQAGRGRYRALAHKRMHVSPFLDEDYDYAIELRFPCARLDLDGARSEQQLEYPRVALTIDVVPRGGGEPIVATHLSLTRHPATRARLTRALADTPPTHRVSLAIHWQAFKLWCKRVPFVPHPSRRTP